MRREWIEMWKGRNHEYQRCKSPSMRREWIEMQSFQTLFLRCMSPSMRREWIEIHLVQNVYDVRIVSLHAEGVD